MEEWFADSQFWENHVHPDDREPTVARSREATAVGKDHELEYRAIAADNRVVWLRDLVQVATDGQGQPRLLRGVMVDITDGKRAEEALVEYAGLLKSLRGIDQAILAAQSPEAIAQDALGHIRHLIPCQRASVALFDLEAREVALLAVNVNGETRVGRGARFSLEEFGMVEALRQGKVHMVGDLRDISQPLPLDQTQQADGVRSYMHVPLICRGELIGSLNLGADRPEAFTPKHVDIVREVADQLAIAIQQARLFEEVRHHAAELEQRVQERTQELAAANRRLQAASRHKSEFLANMSHEFRTPLNSIIGFAELLLAQTVDVLSEKQIRYLTHIHNSGKHLLQLISDILDLSKVEAGKFTLRPIPLPVAATLEDILVIARGLANKKRQTVAIEIAADLPSLQADPVRFKQIFFNLLSNAVKFTPDGGRITLRAHRVTGQSGDPATGQPGASPECQIAQLPECLEVRVTDTGVGIRAEDLPRLFKEFSQLDTTQAQRHEGTGLGLALTKRLVELHGGRI